MAYCVRIDEVLLHLDLEKSKVFLFWMILKLEWSSNHNFGIVGFMKMTLMSKYLVLTSFAAVGASVDESQKSISSS